jgi:hypothetical protein
MIPPTTKDIPDETSVIPIFESILCQDGDDFKGKEGEIKKK